MYIKLPSSYVDPRTQAPLPNAVLVVFDVEFRLRAGDTRVILAVYSNPSVVDIAEPIAEFGVALSTDERNTQLPALLQALYTILISRPEYADCQIVA